MISRRWLFAIVYAAIMIPLFVFLNYVAPLQISDPFSDLHNYKYFYDNARFEPLAQLGFWFEPGYSLVSVIASFFISFGGFVALISFVLCSALVAAMAKWPVNRSFIFIFAITVFFLYFPFTSLSKVALRQGLASAAFLSFLACRDPLTLPKTSLLRWSCFFLSFHFSAAFLIGSLLLARLVRGPFAFKLWLTIVVLYVLNLSGQPGALLNEQLGVANMSLNSLNTDVEYTVGFKPQFFGLSAAFVLFPFLCSWLGLLGCSVKKIFDSSLFRLYFVLNSAAMLTAELPYHDRFFLWSWILGPVLVIAVLGQLRRRSAS